MSLDVQRDTSTPPPSAPLESAPSGSIPFKVRLSLIRQRIILTLRWWFRLDIDDIKETQRRIEIDGLLELNSKASETIKTLTRIVGQMQSRLQYYEKGIPRMRMLYEQWRREQEKLEVMANGESSEERKQREEHGILADVESFRQRASAARAQGFK